MNTLRRCLLLTLSGLFANATLAQNFVTDVDTTQIRALPTSQALPNFPGGDLRTGQEGWVRINFIVSDLGRVLDPVIVDSIGGETFEQAALATLDHWRFEPAPAGTEIGNNEIDMRFEIYRGRDLATANFLRRYRRIVTHLVNDETAAARDQADQALELGGWNLYESAMLCLMVGRVEGQEGDFDDKLEYYRRALGVANEAALSGADRREVLVRIFEAEQARGQIGSARTTLAALRAEPGSQDAIDGLQTAIDTLELGIEDEARIVAKGKIASACDCDDGMPLWSYTPVRKVFLFANIDGVVGDFEARCDRQRLRAAIEPGKRYALPAGGENCRVFVFGEDDARFDFIEPGNDSGDEENAVSALVLNRTR